jgi:hypothetical protein
VAGASLGETGAEGADTVNLLQTWLLIGVPGVVVVAALFVGHSQVRALLGFLTLGVLVVVFVLTPGGGPSAAVVGVVGLAAVATGRGSRQDDQQPEHHEQRRRYTTAASE